LIFIKKIKLLKVLRNKRIINYKLATKGKHYI